jgi:hypothetical protein
MRTRRARRNHRLAERQPVNTHVQKAAPAQPEREDGGIEDEFQGQRNTHPATF